jgi:MYXO-CTERM domain-containing protein
VRLALVGGLLDAGADLNTPIITTQASSGGGCQMSGHPTSSNATLAITLLLIVGGALLYRRHVESGTLGE